MTKHVRVRVHHQEQWYHNVVNVTSDGRYLTLELSEHPSRVHFWLGGRGTDVLVCQTDADVIAALRAEHPERWQ